MFHPHVLPLVLFCLHDRTLLCIASLWLASVTNVFFRIYWTDHKRITLARAPRVAAWTLLLLLLVFVGFFLLFFFVHFAGVHLGGGSGLCVCVVVVVVVFILFTLSSLRGIIDLHDYVGIIELFL